MPLKSPRSVSVVPDSVASASPAPVIVDLVCGVVGMGDSRARYCMSCAVTVSEIRLSTNAPIHASARMKSEGFTNELFRGKCLSEEFSGQKGGRVRFVIVILTLTAAYSDLLFSSDCTSLELRPYKRHSVKNAVQTYSAKRYVQPCSGRRR